MPRLCDRSEATKKCSGCQKKWYCSEKCQRENWPSHIFDCNRTKPIPTSYYLYRAALRDEFPQDEKTRQDYGFARTAIACEHSKLLGLYRGLFIYLEVNPGDVHRWRKNGTLIQEIKNAFDAWPPQNRGQYYPWFLQNQYLLDPNYNQPEDLSLPLFRSTWANIGEDPTITSDHKVVIETWPIAKQDCFWMYHITLCGWHPSPDSPYWVSFGFCVCISEWEENRLGGMFKRIIIERRCPFAEFTAAYDSKTLFNLFQKYGLEAEARGFKYLEIILSRPWKESAWNLKAWVLCEDSPAIPSITVDYGIMNCGDNVEHLQLLKTTYKKVFEHPEGDPMMLHQACIKGQIFPFVNNLVKLKKRDAKLLRSLMTNIYPFKDVEELQTEPLLT
jgi:hypothetical protein